MTCFNQATLHGRVLKVNRPSDFTADIHAPHLIEFIEYAYFECQDCGTVVGTIGWLVRCNFAFGCKVQTRETVITSNGEGRASDSSMNSRRIWS